MHADLKVRARAQAAAEPGAGGHDDGGADLRPLRAGRIGDERDDRAERRSAPARIAACVAGRRTAIRAVSQPATSANTAPQTMLAILNQTAPASCGACPDS